MFTLQLRVNPLLPLDLHVESQKPGPTHRQTLANKLEYDVICSDIQCESIGTLGSKNILFWSWLSVCVNKVKAIRLP